MVKCFAPEFGNHAERHPSRTCVESGGLGEFLDTSTAQSELKHAQDCACSPCVQTKDKLVSMQEQYLSEQG